MFNSCHQLQEKPPGFVEIWAAFPFYNTIFTTHYVLADGFETAGMLHKLADKLTKWGKVKKKKAGNEKKILENC